MSYYAEMVDRVADAFAASLGLTVDERPDADGFTAPPDDLPLIVDSLARADNPPPDPTPPTPWGGPGAYNHPPRPLSSPGTRARRRWKRQRRAG